MASLRDIRKRIRSVKNTRQITKAMKMVSAAKLRRAQDGVISARPFAQTLDTVMAQLISRAEPGSVTHPMLTTRVSKKIELIVVTSDRGLAGGFNSNVNRRALKFIAENKGVEVSVSTIGRKGNEFLRGRGVTIRKDWAGTWQKVKYETAEAIGQEYAKRFLDGDCDAVYLLYNEFVSMVSQVPHLTRLLPFDATGADKTGGSDAAGKSSKNSSLVDFKYEPGPQAVLDTLVPKAVSVKVYRALLESVASEHAARMSAMENATKNAGEMIGSLTLFYNRSRQALITKELMEIVSGAEALKG